MKEEMFFLDIPFSGRKLFIHVHCPSQSNGEAFVFLNPIFDEKKRVQRFQAETARGIAKLNYFVVRFDYYGTGDSLGELYELDFYKVLEDVEQLFEYIFNKYDIKLLKLLGIRFGADLAALISSKHEFIRHVYMVEPIIRGSRFLIEQRFRRKSFLKIHKMDTVEQQIQINSESYEDHQGYPLSEKLLKFINSVITDELSIKDKSIHLFTLKPYLQSKIINKFKSSVLPGNQLTINEVPCESFWNSLETIDTSCLTSKIISSFNN